MSRQIVFGDIWFNDFGGKKNIGILDLYQRYQVHHARSANCQKVLNLSKRLEFFVSGIGKGTKIFDVQPRKVNPPKQGPFLQSKQGSFGF